MINMEKMSLELIMGGVNTLLASLRQQSYVKMADPIQKIQDRGSS